MQRDEALARLRSMTTADEAVPEWINELARWALEEIRVLGLNVTTLCVKLDELEARIAAKDAVLDRMTAIANALCQGCCEQVLPSKEVADQFAYEIYEIEQAAKEGRAK